ncbi:unnamed protein product [Penicillium salamii]|nr:unnamed protein product [Penicillium salamii]CAG8358043.1 unnamed protein product [Penicillium salamii]
MSLVNFPTELLVQVISCLEYASDLCAFSQTHPLFHPLVQPRISEFLKKETLPRALADAAKKGNEAAVRRLLELGALFPEPFVPSLIEAPGDPMALATKNGHMEIVKIFLEHGRDPCVISGCYEDKEDFIPANLTEIVTRPVCENPIMLAARKGHGAILNLLMKYASKETYHTERVGRIWEEPLTWAVWKQNIPIIKTLLEDDPESIEHTSIRRNNPLHALAAASPNAHFDETFELLLLHGAKPEKNPMGNRSPIESAFELENLRFVELSFKHAKRPPDTAWLLKKFEEIARKNPKMASFLLSQIDTESAMRFNYEARCRLLRGAVACGSEDLVELLFKRYEITTPRFRDYLPVMGLAVLSGKVGMIKLLLANGKDIAIGPIKVPRSPPPPSIPPSNRLDREGLTPRPENIPFITALLKRYDEVVDFLVESGLDGPLAGREGPQLLFDLALALGHSELVQKLFDRGTAPPVRDIAFEDKAQSIFMAIAGGETVFRALLKNGVTLDPKSLHHKKAFLFAAAEANIPILEIFLDAKFKAKMKVSGIDPSCVSLYHDDGLTLPLIYAAHAKDRNKAEAAVDLLLKRGASINQPTGKGSCSALYAVASESMTWKVRSMKRIVTDVLKEHSGERYVSYDDLASCNRAVPRSQVLALRLLLKKGADPLFWNKHGRSPLCLATVANDTEVVKILLSSFDQQDVPFSDIEQHLRVAASIRTLPPKSRYPHSPKGYDDSRLEQDAEFDHVEDEEWGRENLGQDGVDDDDQDERDDEGSEDDEGSGDDGSGDDGSGDEGSEDEGSEDYGRPGVNSRSDDDGWLADLARADYSSSESDEQRIENGAYEDDILSNDTLNGDPEFTYTPGFENALVSAPIDQEADRTAGRTADQSADQTLARLQATRDTERLIWHCYWRHVYPPPK